MAKGLRRPTRVYTDEFRRAAVARLANESRMAVAKDLDISTSLIDSWKKKLESGAGFSSMRHFDENFKLKAIARLEKESQKDIAADLGIHSSYLATWRAAFNKGKLPAKAGGKKPKKPAAGGGHAKKYSDKFKRDAVARIGRKGQTLADVARALNLSTGLLSTWRKHINEGPNSHLGAASAGPKKKSYYVKVADRAPLANGDEKTRLRMVTHCITLLRGVRSKVNLDDPIHLTAMLVLQTLEGKM